MRHVDETCSRCHGWVWHRSEPCKCKIIKVVRTDDFLEALGGRLRAVRQSKGLSQDQLANLADMSKTGLWQIENGHSDPQAKTIVALAEVLGVTTDCILRGS